MNGDGDVNINDVTSLVNFVLGENGTHSTDINGDGEVNIMDITELVNHILGKNTLMGHGYVDLGLESGTLWATTNIGADTETEIGNFYAWGEITTKTSYTWANYAFCNGSKEKINKYFESDNLSNLTPEDDAAHQNWGGSWRMPTKDETTELRNECVWVLDATRKGYVVTGPNGNSIFLPLTGWYSGTTQTMTSAGYYWSSTVNASTPSTAYCMVCENTNFVHSNLRQAGRCVRAVLTR